MIFQFSKTALDTLKMLKDPDVQKFVEYNDDGTVTIADVKEFEFALDEAIPHYGMTADFEDITPYGRDLYALYDEFLGL